MSSVKQVDGGSTTASNQRVNSKDCLYVSAGRPNATLAANFSFLLASWNPFTLTVFADHVALPALQLSPVLAATQSMKQHGEGLLLECNRQARQSWREKCRR